MKRQEGEQSGSFNAKRYARAHSRVSAFSFGKGQGTIPAVKRRYAGRIQETTFMFCFGDSLLSCRKVRTSADLDNTSRICAEQSPCMFPCIPKKRLGDCPGMTGRGFPAYRMSFGIHWVSQSMHTIRESVSRDGSEKWRGCLVCAQREHFLGLTMYSVSRGASSSVVSDSLSFGVDVGRLRLRQVGRVARRLAPEP